MNWKYVIAILVSVVCCHSHALQIFEGKVTVLEPSYMPTFVYFAMDKGTTGCPAGTWLVWKSTDQSNNRAVYATLLTAFTAGKRIRFHYNDGDVTCTGAHLHMID